MKHLIYMDDIKFFVKKDKELETQIQKVRIYGNNIKMEFGIEKCALLAMTSSKWHISVGIELPNKEKHRTLGEKETYKYLGILEVDIIKQVEMKENKRKKGNSGGLDNYSRKNSIAGTLSKG